MKTFSLEIVKGNIAYQNADLAINSANNYCIMGSGTAEQLRDAGGYLKEDREYDRLVSKAKSPLDKVLAYVNSVRPKPSKIQKECLDHIINAMDSRPFELGDAILTSSGDIQNLPHKPKYIAHAIGMGYDWKKQPKPPVIEATHISVRNSLIKSFDLALNNECKSISMPIMCTSKGGMNLGESIYASKEALFTLDMINDCIDNVTIVLHNEKLGRNKKRVQDFFGI